MHHEFSTRTPRALRQRRREPTADLVKLAGLLLAITAGAPARAVTGITINDHTDPVTLVSGETITIRYDVAKAGASTTVTLARDLAGKGLYDPSFPFANTFPVVDGSDQDATLGKVAFAYAVQVAHPAGRYVLNVVDRADNTHFDLPLTIVPKPETQSISGRVAVLASSDPAAAVPPDTIIWAAKDLNTLVASANVRSDGTYILPLPPGTYVVFAEWFGNLRSQRQVVTVSAGQAVKEVNLALEQGQEVSGTVREGDRLLADVPVEATAEDGRKVTMRTLTDGSYQLILPNGTYTVASQGVARRVTVADGPADGVDFPSPPAPEGGPKPPVGTILTVAGNGNRTFGGDGGSAINARLPSLQGLTVDPAGNLYYGDFRVGRIRKIDTAGIITTVAGSGVPDSIRGLSPLGGLTGFSGDGGPAIAARLQTAEYLLVSPTGDLYFTDSFNNRVRRIDAGTGIITTVAGSGPVGNGKGSFSGDGGPATVATLNIPSGLLLDTAGNLWIGDRNNGRVRVVNRSGIITTVAGGGTDRMTDGAKATSVALNAPSGLAMDAAGNVYIGDIGLAQIFKLSPDGTIRVVAGTGKTGFSGDGGPGTAAEITKPRRPVIDSAGSLFWAEDDNHRVRKLSADGIISTVAGSGPAGAGVPGAFAGDGGPATQARLNLPVAVAIDAEGNLLIADQANARIRKVIGVAAPGVLVPGG